MKKRTLAALLGTLTALSSVAPTMAQAAEKHRGIHCDIL